MKPLTLFSWGYYGWGTTTRKLVKLVDAIEAKRGFQPPVFVDIRMKRAVRAPGFAGTAFQRLVGDDRYVWMKALGNRSIETKDDYMVIVRPEAADQLLDLAIEASNEKRRIIFFCSCRWPKTQHRIQCHRCTVTALIVKAAMKRRVSAQIVEWPGGKRDSLSLEVSRAQFDRIWKGARYIPLPKSIDPVALEGPAWATIAEFTHQDESIHRLVGPAKWIDGRWNLEMLWYDNEQNGLCRYKQESDRQVISEGWAVRKAVV